MRRCVVEGAGSSSSFEKSEYAYKTIQRHILEHLQTSETQLWETKISKSRTWLEKLEQIKFQESLLLLNSAPFV
jgi:hypothetical protein